jgi:hypothetical protein
MGSDPESVNPAFDFSCKGPIMSAHAYRPEFVDPFEMERGMPGIRFQKFVVLVGKVADIGR